MGADRDELFDEFVARRYRALVRTAFLLVGDVGQAEDLVQSALYRTFRAWASLREPAAVEAYTRTTMIRLAGRWRRRRWSGEIPSADPSERADSRGEIDRSDAIDLWRALAGLSMPHRTVLVLRFYEDLSEAECAALLNCSVGTVKSRTSRALGALRASGNLEPHPDRREADRA